MSGGEFAGMFARQSSIRGLDIPEWVTIWSPGWSSGIRDAIKEIVGGAATFGSIGVTVVPGLAVSEWGTNFGSCLNYAQSLCDPHRGARPYFRVIACNVHGLRDQNLAAGRTVIILDDSEPLLDFPSEIAGPGEDVILLDLKTTLVAKTNRPIEFTREIFSAGLARDLASLPQWTDSWSIKLLYRLQALLAVNMLAKPERFATGTFLYATDYADHIVTSAFNDRGLRPVWKKDEAQEGDGNAQDAASE